MSARVCRILTTASWIYLVILFTWLGLNIFTGDRFVISALIGFIAIYLFLPLLLVLLVIVACRNRWLGVGFLVGALAFFWLWGAQLIPHSVRNPSVQPVLKVMTYNVLAWHNHIEPLFDTIQSEDPDLLFLQELNSDLAKAVDRNLRETYPYQELLPADNPSGIGVISKFPIRSTSEEIPHRWIGGPQVLQFEWNNQQFMIVNFHMFSTTGVFPLSQAELSFRLREQQARLLVDLARRSDSVILAVMLTHQTQAMLTRSSPVNLAMPFARLVSALGIPFQVAISPEAIAPISVIGMSLAG
jgi:endonuclease/exonuclease/phosphatase (EEP) superfamily protein YafD